VFVKNCGCFHRRDGCSNPSLIPFFLKSKRSKFLQILCIEHYQCIYRTKTPTRKTHVSVKPWSSWNALNWHFLLFLGLPPHSPLFPLMMPCLVHGLFAIWDRPLMVLGCHAEPFTVPFPFGFFQAPKARFLDECLGF
jgi:hypothetical protein